MDLGKIDAVKFISKLRQLGLFIQDVENNIAYPNYIWEEMGYEPEDMVNGGFLKYVHPDDLESVEKKLKDCLVSNDDLVRSLFRMKSRSGEWRWILSTSLGVELNDKGEIAGYIGYDHDVTEEIRAKENAEKSFREAETLRSAAEIITSHLSLEETIEAILEQADRVISFTCASVQLLKGDNLEIVGGRGFRSDVEIKGLRFSLEEDIPNSKVIKDKKPLIINDRISETYSGFRVLDDELTRSWMGLPLLFQNRITGLLAFNHREEKQFSPEDLPNAQAFAHQVAIALENARLYEEAREQAIRDDLTGCYSRGHFFECLRREIDLYERYRGNLALIIFDIDNFKSINDNFGHLTGDKILKDVVKLASSVLRDSDILCRYGGEEFTVLIPSGTIDNAYSAAERVRKIIMTQLPHPDGSRIVTVSLGCSVYSSEDEKNPDRIISRADTAMYRAKKTGRNRTCIN
ncbi:sensor domain-containing diguanylate cyclase [Spirochaeta isovalerica]|uniref:diguanylate cyclase n=1 Tax=Spirochaeta isovalerica TaxID=150 RepID=A0A841R6E8_9SPIO|nr:GGDEF domain-containing protein [Spirochaeta isovalerica]MBB6479413.1 diguanylate cyclase (GGDEF)-like protein/PAS domain S-box-containing protein [Spirochaeta isovalerica]